MAIEIEDVRNLRGELARKADGTRLVLTGYTLPADVTNAVFPPSQFKSVVIYDTFLVNGAVAVHGTVTVGPVGS